MTHQAFQLCHSHRNKFYFDCSFSHPISTKYVILIITIVTDKLREHPNYPIFIQWVSNKNSLENFKKTASNKNALENLIPLEEQIEILELKLQQSTELLKDLQ